MSATKLPYEDTTAGEKALGETQKILPAIEGPRS